LGTTGLNEIFVEDFGSENIKGSALLEDLDIEGETILNMNLILKMWLWIGFIW
jgi:hypothetical protein